MAQLSNYDVVVNGMATTLRLSDADAKKRGLTTKTAPAPAKTAAPKKSTAPSDS